MVPVGIHYERAWAWQSDVEVVLGPPLPLDLPPGSSGPAAVDLLHRHISAGLEAVAVAAPDAESFARCERAAYTATLGSERSYFTALKALEAGVPEAETALAEIEKLTADRPLSSTRAALRPPPRLGEPFMPCADAAGAAAGLLNLPPLLIAWSAGRRFADARNTIALWRLLAGFPAFLGWIAGLLALAIMTGHWPPGCHIALPGGRAASPAKSRGQPRQPGAPRTADAPLALHRQIDAALGARGL